MSGKSRFQGGLDFGKVQISGRSKFQKRSNFGEIKILWMAKVRGIQNFRDFKILRSSKFGTGPNVEEGHNFWKVQILGR